MTDAADAKDELDEELSLDDLSLDSPPAEKTVSDNSRTPQEKPEKTTHQHAQESSPSVQDFVEGWQLGVYRDPILCGGFAGIVLASLGIFVVLRRAVFATAAISQGAALGVALSFLGAAIFGLAIPPVLGALILSLAVAAVLVLPASRLKLPKESFVGFAYLSAAGLAVLVGDRIHQEAHDVASILFGSGVVVRSLDLLLVLSVGSLVLILLAATYRGLLFSGFDPNGARVQGIPVAGLEITLWVLVAASVSVTTRALGALPVFAMVVLPAMTSLCVGRRMRHVLLLSPILGGLVGVGGYLFAFFLSFPVGASQTVLAALAFSVAFGISLLRKG